MEIGSQKVDSEAVKELRSLAETDKKHESPSLNRFPDRNSLPFSTSLRALANKSVAALSSAGNVQFSQRMQDFPVNNKPFHHRNNSSLL